MDGARGKYRVGAEGRNSREVPGDSKGRAAPFVFPGWPLEVYVRAFPDKGGQWTVSVGGGHYPVWSANARELFYRTEDGQVMVARYSANGDTFVSDPPKKFSDRKLAPLQQNGTYDVAPDGRIVGLFPAEDEGANRAQSHVTFLINFADEIRRRVGTGK
jgi:hypothetical protein